VTFVFYVAVALLRERSLFQQFYVWDSILLAGGSEGD